MTASLVRRAKLEDAEAIGEVHYRAWQEAYRAHLAPELQSRFDLTARANQWRVNMQTGAREVLVAVQGEDVVGFCSVAPCRDADAVDGAGEVTALYVDPSSWRGGHGKALLSAGRDHARRMGWRVLSLWVLSANAAARAFYAAQGFLPDGTDKTEGDPPLHEVRYRMSLEAEPVLARE
ncbi:MAG TPA: GNAT family N-acetyltransferase, partial [Polyangiaceae bacterium]